jgi:CRP-like cAMP-binding protein
MSEADDCIYPETIKIGLTMTAKTDLSGNLSFLNLADLIQLIGSNGATGILRILGHYSQHPGLIYFENGNPINAENGTLTGIDALNSLFGWIRGEFEFIRQSKVTSEKNITKSRMQVIMDGTRMLDDGLIEKLGPVSFHEKPTPDSQKSIGGPLIRGPLVDYLYIVDEEEFEDGEEIVVQGKHGNWIWVILEGVVQIVKETPMGPLNISRLSHGAFIGSIASFLIGGNIRSATTIAIGKVQLGVLDSQRLFVEFSRLSPELRGILLSLDKRLKQITEKAVAYYLKSESSHKSFSGKTPLIGQGESDERLFKISHGHAFIVRKLESQEMVLGRLEPGDFIGPLPFTTTGLEPESASIYGSDDIKLEPLNPKLLQSEFEQLSTTFKNVIENLATNTSVTSLVAETYKKVNK